MSERMERARLDRSCRDGDRCLARLPSPAVLRDGTAVCVRAIRPDDKERLRGAFAGLSSRSVYQRFFHPINELTDDHLRRLTEIDFRDHVGIVLTIKIGEDERVIALGRYVRMSSGGNVAEIAFTVADDFQRRGAASLLLRELVAIARECGVREFVATMLDDNRAMLQVFRDSKLPIRESFVDGVRRVVLSPDLSETADARQRPRWPG
jgi:RimJ/RimL family protein N-acetyltransferase